MILFMYMSIEMTLGCNIWGRDEVKTNTKLKQFTK